MPIGFEFRGTPEPKWMAFRCPRGHGECLIALRPQTFTNGAGWNWDGNREAPTISPSINCLSEHNGRPAAGCGWHGWIRAGKFENA